MAKYERRKGSKTKEVVKNILGGAAILLVSVLILSIAPIYDAVYRFGSTVATVNGTKLTKKDLQYYLFTERASIGSYGEQLYEMMGYYGKGFWGSSASQWFGTSDQSVSVASYVKESALQKLISQETYYQYAKKEAKLALTDEEKATAKADVETFKTSYAEFLPELKLSDKELLKTIEKIALINKLYAEATGSFVFDEEQFQQYYTSYKADNRKNLVSITANLIHVETREEAEAAITRISAGGEDFIDVLKDVSVGYDSSVPDENLEFKVTEDSGLPVEVIDAVYDPFITEGRWTDPIEVEGDGFYIARAVVIEEPDYDELEATQRSEFESGKKDEMFSLIVSPYETAAKVNIDKYLAAIQNTNIPGIDLVKIQKEQEEFEKNKAAAEAAGEQSENPAEDAAGDPSEGSAE